MPLLTLTLLGLAAAAINSDHAAAGDVAVAGDMGPPDEWHFFDSIFNRYGALYDIDPKYLKAIALNESNLGREKSVALGMRDPSNTEGSKSSDGKSWGLMQVTLITARDFDPTATPAKLNDPEYAVNAACQTWNRNLRYFSEADPRWLEWMVKSYNQGAGNSLKETRGETPPRKADVQKYWERFLRNLQLVNERP